MKPVNKPDRALSRPTSRGTWGILAKESLVPPIPRPRSRGCQKGVCPTSLPEIPRFTAQHFPPGFHAQRRGETESVPKRRSSVPEQSPQKSDTSEPWSRLRGQKEDGSPVSFRTSVSRTEKVLSLANLSRVFFRLARDAEGGGSNPSPALDASSCRCCSCCRRDRDDWGRARGRGSLGAAGSP